MLYPAAQPITALYQRHLDEIQDFLGLRPHALRSPDHNPRSMRLFDARLEAHVDALVVAGAAATPFVLDALDMDTEFSAAAAGLALARAEDRAVDARTLFEKVEEPEDVDPDGLAEVPHPDAGATRQRWHEVRGQLANAVRLYRGVDVGAPGLGVPAMLAFDMQAYGHAFLRASFRGESSTQFLDFWRHLLPAE